MPEFPDITVYLDALHTRIMGHVLERVQLNSPFLLRTASPDFSAVEQQKVLNLRRLGKRICFGFENDLWLVLHLMIAGRLHWKARSEAGAGAAQPTGRGPLPRLSKNTL